MRPAVDISLRGSARGRGVKKKKTPARMPAVPAVPAFHRTLRLASPFFPLPVEE
jgi:hypothetical protein